MRSSRVYCPRCGDLLPSIDELATQKNAVGRPPIHDKPFIGTISGIRKFLEQSLGAETRIWQYSTSHSILILKIDSLTDNTHALVVCLMTKSIIVPNLYWKSSFVLESQENNSDWSLRDQVAGTEIVCTSIGIYHGLNFTS